MSNNICAPIKNKNKIKNKNMKKYDYSCFKLIDLKKIAKQINKKQGTNIDVKKYNSNNKKKLLKNIYKSLKCNNMTVDKCIIKKTDDEFINIVKKRFKPDMPEDETIWLSNFDIFNVMEQYMDMYKDFVFLGAIPIDFAEFNNSISNLNLKKILKTKKRVGIIFNTDSSYESGEHWISMFIDFYNNTICFFDSAGDQPPREVIDLMNKIITNAKQLGIILKPIINKKQKQKNNYSCGIYSLYFIKERLNGTDCNSFFADKNINDKLMKKYRKIFFR